MSTESEDHRENQDAVEVVRRLVAALEKSVPQSMEAMPPLVQTPTTADEFCDVLERLHEVGVRFDENGVVSLETESPEEERSAHQRVREMASRFPFVPGEVRHLVNVLLTGAKPDPEVVGESDVIASKLGVLQKFVITPELEDRYFVQRVSKSPVITDLDWGVGIKTAERGWRGSRGIPFAEIALTLTHYNLPGDDQSRVVHACIHEEMLVSLMEELGQALEKLREAKQMAGSMPLRHTGDEEP